MKPHTYMFILILIALSTAPLLYTGGSGNIGRAELYVQPVLSSIASVEYTLGKPIVYSVQTTTYESYEVDLDSNTVVKINPQLIVEYYEGFVFNIGGGNYSLVVVKKNFADDYIRVHTGILESLAGTQTLNTYYRVNGSFVFIQGFIDNETAVFTIGSDTSTLLLNINSDGVAGRVIENSFSYGYPLVDKLSGDIYYVFYVATGRTYVANGELSYVELNSLVPVSVYNGSIYYPSISGGSLVINEVEGGTLKQLTSLPWINTTAELGSMADILDLVTANDTLYLLYRSKSGGYRLVVYSIGDNSYKVYSVEAFGQIGFTPYKLYVGKSSISIVFEKNIMNNYYCAKVDVNTPSLKEGVGYIYGSGQQYSIKMEKLYEGIATSSSSGTSLPTGVFNYIEVSPIEASQQIIVSSTKKTPQIEFSLATPEIKIIQGLPEEISSEDYSSTPYLVSAEIQLLGKPLRNIEVKLVVTYDNITKVFTATTNRDGKVNFIVKNETIPVTTNTTLYWSIEALGLTVKGETHIVFPPPKPAGNVTAGTTTATTTTTTTRQTEKPSQPTTETTGSPAGGGGLDPLLIGGVIAIIVIIAVVVLLLKRR